MSRRYLDSFIATLQVWRYQAQHTEVMERRLILLRALEVEEEQLLRRLWATSSVKPLA